MTTTLVTPDVTALCEALTTTSSALAHVLRRVTDPSPVAVGRWSVGETAAHVSGSGAALLATARGESSAHPLGDVDAANARWLLDHPDRDPRRLADRLESGERALVAFAAAADGDPLVELFAGVDVPLSTLLALELGELLVHGHDIARAVGADWRIDPDAARLVLQGYLPLLPHTLDPTRAAGVRLALEIRIRGMQPVGVLVADGRLTVRDPTELALDAHLATTPEAYLLLMWNRIPPWAPLLGGRLLVWGRRPWRARALAQLMAI